MANRAPSGWRACASRCKAGSGAAPSSRASNSPNALTNVSGTPGAPGTSPTICPPTNLRALSSGPQSGMYTLSWDPPLNETIAEYRIVSFGPGDTATPLSRAAGSALQAVLTNLDPNIGYLVAIVAIDTQGRESARSNTAMTVGAPTATAIPPP